MREGPASSVLAGAAGWRPVAASWLDGRLLTGTAGIPIVSGRLSAARSLPVPERLRFVVPEMDHGTSWVPDAPDHPLARYGQAIDLSIAVRSALNGDETLTRLGRYRVADWHHDDVRGLVEVSCLGVLKRAAEDRFAAPEAPRSGGTLFSEFRRLMVPGVSVSIDPTLVDRLCPASFQWPLDRLDALQEIAEAIPARILMDQFGGVRLLPPLPEVPTPTLTLIAGDGGTVVSAPRSDSREDAYNVFVGTSSATDSTALEPLRAVAAITTGPMAATDDGTGYGRVVRYWSSPLASTQGTLQAAVNALRDASARNAVVRPVTHAPDPRIELDDAIEVRSGPFETVTETVVVTPGAGMAVERVNLITNPSLEVATTGWTHNSGAGGVAAASRQTAGGAVGAAFRRLTWTVAATSSPCGQYFGTTGSDALPVTAGTVYSGSCYARTSLAQSMKLRLYFYNNVGASVGAFVGVAMNTTPDEWALLTVSNIVAPAGAVRALFLVYSDDSGHFWQVGETLDVDGALLEAAATPGPYFDGDTADTPERIYAWSGDPHASASSQIALPTPPVTRTITRLEPTVRGWGYVVAYDLPLTEADGDMRTDIGMVV